MADTTETKDGKTLYDWAALILGTGVAIQQSKNQAKVETAKNEIAFHESELAKEQSEAEYIDLVKKVAIGVGAIFAAIIGIKMLKKI